MRRPRGRNDVRRAISSTRSIRIRAACSRRIRSLDRSAAQELPNSSGTQRGSLDEEDRSAMIDVRRHTLNRRSATGRGGEQGTCWTSTCASMKERSSGWSANRDAGKSTMLRCADRPRAGRRRRMRSRIASARPQDRPRVPTRRADGLSGPVRLAASAAYGRNRVARAAENHRRRGTIRASSTR